MNCMTIGCALLYVFELTSFSKEKVTLQRDRNLKQQRKRFLFLNTKWITLHSKMKEALKWIFKIVPVPIIIMGTLGNILCGIVCRRKKLKEHAFSICLIVLAVADTGILHIGLWQHWLHITFGYEFIRRSSTMCKLSAFLLWCFGDLSSWVLCLITIQRFISVWLPNKAKSLSSHTVSANCCATVAVLSIVKNFHFLTVEYKTVPDYQGNYSALSGCCEPENPHHIDFLLNEWGIFDLTMAAILPFTILATCNSMIIAKLWKAAASKKSTVETSRQKEITHINVMLMINSMAFLILVMPWYMVVVIQTYTKGGSSMTGIDVAYSLTFLLWYINPAINFYMYCLGGPLFRRELKALFRRGNSIGNADTA